jgi:hypothetical protein
MKSARVCTFGDKNTETRRLTQAMLKRRLSSREDADRECIFTRRHWESGDALCTNYFRILILHSSQTEPVSETVCSRPLLELHRDSLQSPEGIWTCRCKAVSSEGREANH